eukprot:g3377.t1
MRHTLMMILFLMVNVAHAMFDADVIVVGIGPVGAYASLLLSKHGNGAVSVLAFDKYGPEPYFSPRAVCWDDPTLRSGASAGGIELDAWMRWHANALDTVQQAGRDGFALLGTSALGKKPFWHPVQPHTWQHLRKRRDKLMSRLTTQFGWFHQPSWERQLRRHLKNDDNVQTHFNSKVIHTRIIPAKDGGGCEVEVVNKKDPSSKAWKYRARFCIGADGATSDVRTELGVKVEGIRFEDDPWIVIDTEFNDEQYLRSHWVAETTAVFFTPPIPVANLRTPAYMEKWWNEATEEATEILNERFEMEKAENKTTILPPPRPGSRDFESIRHEILRRRTASYIKSIEPSGKPLPPVGLSYRFEFLLPTGVTEREAHSDEFIQKLWDTAKIDPSRIDIIRKVVYIFAAKQAKTYSINNTVFLAGDAAHQTPPFKGQGMNMGVADTVNLTWKMVLVLRGLASESILETYEEERRDVVQQVIDESVELGKVFGVRNWFLATIRDWTLRFVTTLIRKFMHYIGRKNRKWLARRGFGDVLDIFMNRDNQHIGKYKNAVLPPIGSRHKISGIWIPAPRVRPLADEPGKSWKTVQEGSDHVQWAPHLSGSYQPDRGGVEGLVWLDSYLAANGFSIVHIGSLNDPVPVKFTISEKCGNYLVKLQTKFVSVVPHQKHKSFVTIAEKVGARIHLTQNLKGKRVMDAEGFFTTWAANEKLLNRLIVVRPDKFVFSVYDNLDVACTAIEKALMGNRKLKDEL